MSEKEVLKEHREAGSTFNVNGVKSFARSEGKGPTVLLIHGVPASSYLYRKVLPELANRGFRAISFDLPGLGYADRPKDFDYSWTGLGSFATEAVDALGLETFHLVVHDIGGPVGFELASKMPERIETMTVLNTVVDAATFTKPWSMRPFGVRGLGSIWLRSMTRPGFRYLMSINGIADTTHIPKSELDAWIGLLKRDDGGKAFLKIMRGFETTAEKQDLYRSTLRQAPYPIQVIWGDEDPALTLEEHGEAARSAAGVDTIHRLPAKHFLQEDQAVALAERIAAFARA